MIRNGIKVFLVLSLFIGSVFSFNGYTPSDSDERIVDLLNNTISVGLMKYPGKKEILVSKLTEMIEMKTDDARLSYILFEMIQFTKNFEIERSFECPSESSINIDGELISSNDITPWLIRTEIEGPDLIKVQLNFRSTDNEKFRYFLGDVVDRGNIANNGYLNRTLEGSEVMLHKYENLRSRIQIPTIKSTPGKEGVTTKCFSDDQWVFIDSAINEGVLGCVGGIYSCEDGQTVAVESNFTIESPLQKVIGEVLIDMGPR